MVQLCVTFIKELINNYRLEICWSYQVSAFITLNRRVLFIFVTYTCGWLLSFLELFNINIKNNTLFRKGAIIRIYRNKITCARASRRITGQYTKYALYTRASRRITDQCTDAHYIHTLETCQSMRYHRSA